MKMDKIKKTIDYLLRYKMYSLAIMFFIIVGTTLEGFSASMIIPFLQQIISPGTSILPGLPFLKRIAGFINYADSGYPLFIILIFLFFLILFKSLFLLFGKRIIWKLRFSIYRDLQNELFGLIVNTGLTFFDKNKSGHIMHSFNRETERIATYMFNFLTLVTVVLQIIVYLAVLAVISWKFTIGSFLMVMLIFPVVHLIRKNKELYSIASNKSQADLNFILMEILTGMRTIKLFIAENISGERFRENLREFISRDYKSNIWQELLSPAFEVFIFGSISLIFGISIVFFRIDFSKILPEMVAFMWIMFRTFNQVNSFNHFRTEMAGCIGAFNSYEELVGKLKDAVLPNGSIKIETLTEKITFENATFGYSSDRKVLRDVSFVIPKGRVTAIVGGSGEGKSTVVHLIPRLYDIEGGKILVDGIDLKDIDIYSWRRLIGFVSQDVFIFNSTARENIILGLKKVSSERIINAAKTANIHDFITSLPSGYDTILGERGIRLSGGQKQRISIARAVIREPEILILDEATSSLDSESEYMVQEAIDKACHNRTVIVIAHRLSTVRNADQLIVIEEGKIIEQGTHEGLIKSKGRYWQLYSKQFNGQY